MCHWVIEVKGHQIKCIWTAGQALYNHFSFVMGCHNLFTPNMHILQIAYQYQCMNNGSVID